VGALKTRQIANVRFGLPKTCQNWQANTLTFIKEGKVTHIKEVSTQGKAGKRCISGFFCPKKLQNLDALI
jgi:hypothetical protein